MKLQVARAKPGEKGVALILALFALLLISAVGVAIVFMSSGETSLAANERSYTQAWEYAKDGLEEARSRLSRSDNNYLAANIPPDACHVLYIENPGPGEAALYFPTNAAPTGKYADTEYASEWGAPLPTPPPPCATMTITTVNSDMQSIPVADLPAIPAYKWVRITVKTEKSAQEDVDQDGSLDLTNSPISWDGFDQRECGPASASPPCPSSPPPTDTIVYRATALAVLPNGTTRMAQYDLKPGTPIPSFPGALTLCAGSALGVNVFSRTSTVQGSGFSSSFGWQTSGYDQVNPLAPPIPGIATCGTAANNVLDPAACPGPEAAGPAVCTAAPGCCWKRYDCTGAGSAETGNVIGALNLTGAPNGCLSIIDASSTMSPCLRSASCLQSLANTITAEAAAVNPPCSQLGTLAAPQITVYTVDPQCGNGSAPTANGYGILLATSELSFYGSSKFNGLTLVIGTGVWEVAGTSCFNGGVFVANITGGVLGTPTIGWNGGGNCGTGYNSTYVNLAKDLFPYKILAAREINF